MTDSSPSTTFLLVRHAQTIWNQEQRHAGSSEIALSVNAQQQIALLTRTLIAFPIDHIYSSPLSRCLKTIEPTAAICDLPIHQSEQLRERHLGSWEGKSPRELAPTHPGYHFPISAYTGQFRIPGAEPLEEFEQRLRHFLKSTSEDNPDKLVVVATHSGVIWTIQHRIVSNKADTVMWPGNCSLCIIRAQSGHYFLEAFFQNLTDVSLSF